MSGREGGKEEGTRKKDKCLAAIVAEIKTFIQTEAHKSQSILM